MSFQRARKNEDKKIRLTEIKNAAIAVLNEQPYVTINLSTIGDKCNFTRPNLYKYISSKEDIYLLIYEDELNDIRKMFFNLLKNGDEDKEVFKKFAIALDEHPTFMKLSTLISIIIEQNINYELLVKFKKFFLSFQIEVMAKLKEYLDINDEKLNDLVTVLFLFPIGLFPNIYFTDIQRKAMQEANYPIATKGFVEIYTEFLFTYYKGLIS